MLWEILGREVSRCLVMAVEHLCRNSHVKNPVDGNIEFMALFSLFL